MRKTKWLDRTLIIGPDTTLCLGYEEYVALLSVKGRTPPGRIAPRWRSVGRCEVIDGPKGLICIIVIQDFIGRGLAEVIGVLNHEASHAMEQYYDDIGERRPSSEFRAYSYQAMSQNLIEEFLSRVNLSRTLIVTSLKE